MINGKRILAISERQIESKYVDTWRHPPELTEDVLRALFVAIPHDMGAIVKTDNQKDLDACIERSQIGLGCVSTTYSKPDGKVCIADADWLAKHDFSHAGLTKCEISGEADGTEIQGGHLIHPDDFSPKEAWDAMAHEEQWKRGTR